MINQFYTMIYSTLILSSSLAILSSNWLFMWMAMELNLLCFIPLITLSNQFQETEATTKYFLIQALGSSILLASSTTLWNNMEMSQTMSMILIISLMIKMGLAPFHMWYPSVMSSISWLNCFILSSWQKLAPLMFIVLLNTGFMKFMLLIASLNALLGGMLGMNQTKVRAIMAYSSITHLGWITGLMSYNKYASIVYFMMYSLLIMPLFMMMYNKNILYMNQMYTSHTTMLSNFMLALLLMSLSGLPPLTGFMMKWMSITYIAPHNQLLLIILISGSIMSTYYYLSMMFNALMVVKLNSVTMQMKQASNMTFTSMLAITSLLIMPFLISL